MSATPEDFHISANELIKGDREIDYRNAASRAYYSSFLACRDFAGDPRRASNDEGSHDACINYYIKDRNGQNDKDRIHMRIGYKLRKMKSDRVRADYRTEDDFTESDAQQTVTYVGEINELIATIDEMDTAEQG